MLLIVLMYALFAGTFSLGKILACYSQPIFLVGIRMFLAGSFLMAYEFMQHGSNWRFDRKHIWYYVQIILFTTYIPYSLRFWALRSEMTASKACLLYNLSPFMTYIFSYFLYSEKVTIKKVIGLIIGFIGFLPTVLPAIKSEHGQAAFLSMPEIAILCSVACLSYGWIMIHRLVKFHNYEATTINSMSMFCGGLLALITSWLFESSEAAIEVGHVGTFLLILAVVIIVSNLLCHNLYVTLLKTYSPTFLSFASFLSPLFAALYGWLFLSEPTPWTFWATAICVLTGLAIFYHDELYGSASISKPALTQESVI
ncbi:MAG TPA: DMT family transporter [Candidatus Babeliales bacterium]|nr:DMT family transporter [Candidatus Babeliales bacterium]